MKKLNKGFTIIELLIVIAITGVLATAMTPKIFKEIRKATVATVQHNLGVIRSRLSIDEALSEDFPDLANEEGEDKADLLKTYSIESTPAFADEDGVGHGESSKIVTVRDNTGGWFYIRDTGEFYANLPNGAYTGDKEYEIWDELKNGGDDKNDSWENINDKDKHIQDNIRPGSQVTIFKQNGEYVMVLAPEIGWFNGGELTGKFSVYIADKLVNEGEGDIGYNGNSIKADSFLQEVELGSEKLILAFEYKTDDGSIKIAYKEFDIIQP